MYHITLYEGGRFCSHIGGAVDTLPEAIDQLKRVSATLQATELEEYFGVKFDRAGTICALLVTDRWECPIRQEKNDED